MKHLHDIVVDTFSLSLEEQAYAVFFRRNFPTHSLFAYKEGNSFHIAYKYFTNETIYLKQAEIKNWAQYNDIANLAKNFKIDLFTWIEQ